MVKFEEVIYKNFGRCISVSNGAAELLVTIDIGPRIIRFAKPDGENIMFEDTDNLVNKDDCKEIFEETFGKDLGTWRIYGGHRLWASPEVLPRTYYPDCEPVAYTIDKNSITLTPPPQRYNQQQYEIKIVMDESAPKVDIHHKITNIGPWGQKFAPWCLSVLCQNGTEVIPVPDRPTGLLHNRKITFWDYTEMTDPRVKWGDKYITLKQDPTAESNFKIGLDSQHGWAAYFVHGDLFIKKFDIIENAEYPDDGMNFETYTSNLFLEMESLGEYKTAENGESISHHESWELAAGVAFPGDDEAKITAVMEKYIK